MVFIPIHYIFNHLNRFQSVYSKYQLILRDRFKFLNINNGGDG